MTKQEAIAELYQKFCDCPTGETGIVMTLERVWDAAIEAAAEKAENYDSDEHTDECNRFCHNELAIAAAIRELKK